MLLVCLIFFATRVASNPAWPPLNPKLPQLGFFVLRSSTHTSSGFV